MPMFKTLLIANRGEIACRVMRTAAAMNIKPIAVYSDADREALHVKTALALGGDAIRIGPALARDSYLNIQAILQACQDSGAEAVHPGYGFLSENRDFAAALEKAGISFIGPPSAAIEAMGDKIRSKILAEKAKVNVVPGHVEAISDPDEAVRIAHKIGYPVMLKASAGGGGKGMRLAHNDEECRSGLLAAMNEGRASFGDDRVFVEKFIDEPRHIEIQILGDKHGRIVYLQERECSLQRRHQKVIEEAPSPFLDEKTRQAMGEQAVALARKVGYYSAGTVEFIVDQQRNFYFLEMNTRLQVEHPVTEKITGLDLVEWMIRIAYGERLDFDQADVALNGAAIEARVYAEDPERNFLPSTGRLTRYQEPRFPSGQIRCDAGCYEGASISMYYDPMIAKLITYGNSREEALAAMRTALDDYVIEGPGNNRMFLSHLVRNQDFAKGNMSTKLIGAVYPQGLSQSHLTPSDNFPFLALAAWLQIRHDHHQFSAGSHHQGLFELSLFPDEADREGKSARPRYDIIGVRESSPKLVGSEEWHFRQISPDERNKGRDKDKSKGKRKAGDDRAELCLVVEADELINWHVGKIRLQVMINNQAWIVQIKRAGQAWEISHDGSKLSCLAVPTEQAPLIALMPIRVASDMSRFLLSPMPGLLVRLSVKEGDDVKMGQELAVVEAMKMENSLKAVKDGVITSIKAKAGDSLAVDQVIMVFDK